MLTPDQIHQLQSLGIKTDQPTPNHLTLAHPAGGSDQLRTDKLKSNIFPLLSISGLTILSFSGLILLKNKNQTLPASPQVTPDTSVNHPTPTQVPKSIQHYLLASQQFFSQASQNQDIDAFNQSILAATEAVKLFPQDYRGFFQRGRIYHSILASQPQFLSQTIADFTQAQKLNPNNPEITRSLASVYAQKGDASATIDYLSQTIALEPTKAQNFYDLAKIQQQAGLLPQALQTYTQLLTLVTDPNQKTQLIGEKTALEQLISQHPQTSPQTSTPNPIPTITLPQSLDSPTIQASIPSGLIVAAPEQLNQIQISNFTNSNSLSGTAVLPSGTKDITLTNTNISPLSQIYVTVTRGGKNQNLQVISKSNNTFTVGLDTPIPEDIEFKWWIIN
ncbi:MAG: hypothetical protein BWY29_00994 [Microgenomates group bacterium ADurb.Bin238]|jgi:tetratricopeptide (TPR) repeat protein|nr:MAG: hypothetical protein BWY29_00994 [Microgenomates group bacterium ADurb.Bin238]